MPMLLSIGIYFYSYVVITQSAEEIYTASLERVRIELDSMVNTAFQTLDNLIVNSDVQKLSFVRDKPKPEEYWAIVQLIQNLKNNLIVLPVLDDVFVVLNETDTIVSTIGYITDDLYYHLFYENETVDLESFRELIKKPHNRKDVYLVGDYLLFFRTTLEANLSRKTVTVVAAVKQNKFEERFITQNGTIMYIDDMLNNFKYYTPDKAPGSEPYHSLATDSKVINWRYVCLIPVNVQKEKARKIHLITLAGFVVCSLLGLFLSFILSKRNYDPIKKLMAYFKVPGKNETIREDEFVWLEKRTGESLKENQDTRLAIRKYYAQSQYTQETEQKLVNLVRAGNGEEACLVVRQMFSANSFPQGLSERMGQLLAYDLLGTIINGIEQEDSDSLSELNIEDVPAAELPAFVERAVLSICEANRQTIQNKNAKTLCKKVKDYIAENYCNPDINISQTGYHFNISPFYLSSIFRKETGQSLLEYINTLRIEEGKRLLEAGCNINEVAQKIGFHGSEAFIRVFKKITGITPSQYRKIS
jgi:AraC-like DNA-binding protein